MLSSWWSLIIICPFSSLCVCAIWIGFAFCSTFFFFSISRKYWKELRGKRGFTLQNFKLTISDFLLLCFLFLPNLWGKVVSSTWRLNGLIPWTNRHKLLIYSIFQDWTIRNIGDSDSLGPGHHPLLSNNLSSWTDSLQKPGHLKKIILYSFFGKSSFQ